MIIRFLLVKFEIVYSLCNFFGYYSVIRLISGGGLQSNFISCFSNWNTSWIKHYCISQCFAEVKKKKKKRDPRGQHKMNDYIIRCLVLSTELTTWLADVGLTLETSPDCRINLHVFQRYIPFYLLKKYRQNTVNFQKDVLQQNLEKKYSIL